MLLGEKLLHSFYAASLRGAISGMHLVIVLVMMFSLFASTTVGVSPVTASGSLTITSITWDVIGLDSNNVNVGPNHFPVGARVCNTSGTSSTVDVTFDFDDSNDNYSGDPYINLRGGTEDVITLNLAAGECMDAYFEIEVARNSSAYNNTRDYTITADDTIVTESTPSRELFVEHLISQSRNDVTNVEYGTSLGALQSVADGGTLTLFVGETYYIKVSAKTATNGYEQLETFITLPNTIFRVISVETTYTAQDSTYVSYPSDKLYGNACNWIADPRSPNYRSCLDVGKVGGDITVTYQVQILSVPGAPLVNPEPLSTLTYDFSGSSYHYNSDFDVSTRYARIVGPTLTKSFSPKTILSGGNSTLTFTINNPSTAAYTNVRFSDTFTNMSLNGSPTVSYTNCGSPSPAAGSLTPNATSLSFTNITLGGSSTCVITVTSVTSSTLGVLPNTTGNLFVTTGGTEIDTGSKGTDILEVVSTPPVTPANVCNSPVTLATWNFDSDTVGVNNGSFAGTLGGSVTASNPLGIYNAKTGFTTSAICNDGSCALPGDPGAIDLPATVSGSAWGIGGVTNQDGQWPPNNATVDGTTTPSFQFQINASQYGGLYLTSITHFEGSWSNLGTWYILSSTDGNNWSTAGSGSPPNDITSDTKPWPTIASTTGVDAATTTYFRVIFTGASTNKHDATAFLDNVTISGCPSPIPPQIQKSFSPTSIPPSPSRLRFTITNPNSSNLTGVNFTDTLPSGLFIDASTPATITPTCTVGSMSGQTITAANTNGTSTISLSGATLTAAGITAPYTSCYFDVFVNGNTAGTYHNVTTNISSTETGPNTTGGPNVGYGVADLTVTAVPPVITKAFGASSMFTNGTTTLTFTIYNPNLATPLNGVGFLVGDTLPAGLTVASPNGLTAVTCDTGTLTGQTITATAGGTSITMTGGSLSGGASCRFSVNVTANATTGLRTNSVTVTSSTAGNGNTSTANVLVKALTPGVALKKQVGTSSKGPWYDYLQIPVGNPVWYKFTVENTGDVPLNPVTITDNTFTPSCTWSNPVTPLPVAVAANDNHISECIVQNGTAQSGTITNVAHATGTYSGVGYNSPNDSAIYDNDPASPLPVTVAYFHAQRNGSTVNFDWSTSTEAGNLGFNIYVGDKDGQLVKINQDLILSQVFDSLEVQNYSHATDVKGNTFYIEDISVQGETRMHGPFQLGQEYGDRTKNEKIDQFSVSKVHAEKFAENQAALKNELKVPAAAFLPEKAGSNELQLTTSLNLLVDRTGIYRVSYEMMKNAGLDLAGVPLKKVALMNQGQQVPIYVEGKGKFGPGAFIEFYGEALDTFYTDTNVYTVQVSKSPSVRMDISNALPSKKLLSPSSFEDTLSVNRQLNYVFSSPSVKNDAWYDTALLTTKTSKSWEFPFELNGLADPSGASSLSVTVWGATIYDQNPDHHLVISVNDIPVASQLFDGNMEETVFVTLPSGILKKGSNTLKLTLPGDTGAPADLVYFNGFSITYPRLYQAENDQLRFTSAGMAFSVTNLSSKNVLIYKLGENGPQRLNNIKVDSDGSTFTATFAGTGQTSTYFVTTTDALYAPEIEAVRLKVNLNTPAQFLIISHPDFLDGLQPLVQARKAQGLTVSVVDVNDLYAQYSYGIFGPQAIKDYIAYASQNLGTQYVLLVGGDTYDYHNYLGAGSISFIPSLYTYTIGVIKYAPADPLYTDLDNNGTPDLAIGRFPVRTVDQLNLMVQKTLSYDQKDYGNTSVFATDKKDGALSFKIISNNMISNLPAGWSAESINLDDESVTVARERLIGAMNQGAALVTYTGHSGASEWTASKLFNTADASQLTNTGRPFVVTQWGCWNTYYIHPTNNYLVQSFLFSGDNGAAAVLGASTLTNSTSELMLGELLTPQLVTQGKTVGQALQDAKTELASSHPDLRDVLLGWTLMGDPTLVIAP